MKKKTGVVALLLALSMILTACGGSGNSTGDDGSNENDDSSSSTTSTTAITDFVDFAPQASEMDIFLIQMSERGQDTNVLCNCYSPLLEADSYGQLQPAVATEWGSDDDGLTWTFKLRDDVTWVDKDGNYKADCTAQDWLTALEWILNYHKNSGMNCSMPMATIAGASEYYNYTKELEEDEAFTLTATSGPFLETVGIEAPDDYTLIYHCAQNTPYFDTLCTAPCLYPLSQAQIDEIGVAGVRSQDNTTMWYNGPYTITEFISGNSKTLTKNESYWDTDCSLFNTVTILMLEDTSRDDELFMTDEVDYTSLSESTLRTIYENPDDEWYDYLVETPPVNASYQILFNYAKNNEDGTPDENWNTAISNEAFRKSIYYGLDLTSYWSRINYVNPDSCENLTFTMKNLVSFSDGTDYSERVLEKIGLSDGNTRYNADLAQQYKEQAMTELEGKVEFPVQMDYYVASGDQTALDTATVLKEIVETLGTDYINFNICTYINSMASEVYLPGLHSFNIASWSADYGDPENFLNQMIANSENAIFALGVSRVIYATQPDTLSAFEEYTDLVQTASNICSDNDERYEAFAEAEAYLLNHALCVPLYYKVSWQMTKVNDYSKINASYGCQNSTYKNWETSTEPYTAADYAEFEAAHNAG